jgi:hypothetical protein
MDRRHFPRMGMLTILMNDYPWFRNVLLAVMGIFTLTTREQWCRRMANKRYVSYMESQKTIQTRRLQWFGCIYVG